MSTFIYYFEKPTIGCCPRCDMLASLKEEMLCPKCGTSDLSLFKWDRQTRHPENEDDTEPDVCVICGKPADGPVSTCNCHCPMCHTKVFNDVTIPDHGECLDCHNSRLNCELEKN